MNDKPIVDARDAEIEALRAKVEMLRATMREWIDASAARTRATTFYGEGSREYNAESDRMLNAYTALFAFASANRAPSTVKPMRCKDCGLALAPTVGPWCVKCALSKLSGD